MATATVKKSPQGAVVIVRGYGFVTSSALMPYQDAVKLAARFSYEKAKVVER